MAILKSDVIRYAALPALIPRIMKLFSGGFGYAAFLMATIYNAVRLIPNGHPYIDPANIGRFGIRHVISAAATNLVFKRQNIDQILIFFTILTGIVLLITQLILVVVAAFATQPALANAFSEVLGVSSSLNPGPAQDIAFVVLDRVFGVAGIFGSCISTAAECVDMNGQVLSNEAFPFPFHIALHKMFEFYSIGIFIVSVFVIIYYVATLTGETAATGTPFGQRMNKTWAPVRMILFAALLMPLHFENSQTVMNSAQLITLWSAKFGSNFATNAWMKFDDTLSGSYVGGVESLIATPNMPEMADLARFMFLVKVCKIAEEISYNYEDSGGIQAYVIRERQFPFRMFDLPGGDHNEDGTVDDADKAFGAYPLDLMNFEQALLFSNYGNIRIRFGEKNGDEIQGHKSYEGFVKPYCGELTLQTGSADELGAPPSGAKGVQELYFELVKNMWNNSSGAVAITAYAECLVRRTMQEAQDPLCPDVPDAEIVTNYANSYQQTLEDTLPEMIEQQIDTGDWSVSDQLRERGWAGAGIWYNRLADLNGAITGAILQLPKPNKYPFLMELVAETRQRSVENLSPENAFDPVLPKGQKVDYPRFRDKQIAGAMNAAIRFWDTTTASQITPTHYDSGNVLITFINKLFGTSGIFDMRENADKHPLAQLSTLGKAMMDASIRNMGLGMIGERGLSNIKEIGLISTVTGGFLSAMGMATIAMSFVLYYVLPMLPFVYFFFAFGGWVKAIFEAMVAMPLWALAHLRIDGEGLAGPGASNGYFLIFEIFLRPIITLFALVATVSLFAAFVKVLNETFDLVVNVAGYNAKKEASGEYSELMDFFRAPVDQFFFTAMYVVMVYMIGLSCFKLVDIIPNTFMRWMGSTASTFQETDKDAPGKISQVSFKGTLLVTGQVKKGGDLAAIIAK
jgi:conjugal transfer/type IV secretion protein DotA/TraY